MPLSTVFDKTGKSVGTVHIPSVMRFSPIRPDVIQFVHSNLAKNSRQPYGRYARAGHQHSAEGWGTGRAIARIPRISGRGTNCAASGAFGNMCRGGHMYSPLKVWRRWHRLVNVSQKRYAICAALAASSVPALVMARGHKIDTVAEIPLVLTDDVEKVSKTKEAVEILKAIKANVDVQRSADSRKIRPGRGKMRNRRFVQRKGVLIVHNTEEGLSRAFRNISGVSIANVNRLNIRDLAPGGHLGRFIIWTKGAYEKLDQIYGTVHRDAQLKKGYRHPIAPMTTTDLNRIIYSHKVQACIKPKREQLLRIPKIRRDLLLTRKINRQNVTNTQWMKDRQARLEKQRKEAKPTPEKEKRPKDKPFVHLDVYGHPVSRKLRKLEQKKKKEERKARIAKQKKDKLDRVQNAIAAAKEKKAAQKKALEEKAKAQGPKEKKPTTKKPKPLTLAQRRIKKIQRRKAAMKDGTAPPKKEGVHEPRKFLRPTHFREPKTYNKKEQKKEEGEQKEVEKKEDKKKKVEKPKAKKETKPKKE